MGSSSLSCASIVTLAMLGTLGDTYGRRNFFSLSVSSLSTSGGGTGSALWALGIFVGGA